MKTEYIIGAGVAFALFLLKNYFKGGMCRVTRDLTGQVAIVTGGNTGIGKSTAEELARRGCTVLIGARDIDKSRNAVREIRRKTLNVNVECFDLDLSSKLSIERFVDAVKARHSRIDILVNNAGVMAIPDRRNTEDGFEMQMGVNHLGHFYLTHLLWNCLKDSPNLRIVNVSSKAQNRNPVDRSVQLTINFDEMNGNYPGQGPFYGMYHPWYAYAASKMANVLFTQELAARLEMVNPNARVISVHPGVVRTELARYFLTGYKKAFMLPIYPIFWLLTKNCWQGAQTTLYGIMEDKDKLENGCHYADCKLSIPGTFALNPDNRRRLWQRSEQMLGIRFDTS